MPRYPDIYQHIMRKLKASQGCTLRELEEGAPARFSPMDPVSIQSVFYTPVDTLISTGLVEAWVEGKLQSSEQARTRLPFATLYISKTALDIEECFGVQLDKVPTPRVFKSPPDDIGYPDIFVLMPFTKELKPVFDDHIQAVVEECGLSARRADDFFTAHSIIDDIWATINHTSVIIADCTGRNPNVFYEIGIAHTPGKDTILLAQNIDDVPFDLQHLRVLVYEFSPRGMASLEDRLRSTLRISL